MADPHAKGLFAYIRDGIGSSVGFVVGVIYWGSCLIACVAIALAVTGYLGVFIPAFAKPPVSDVVTVTIIWLIVAANVMGPRFVAGLQGWSLALGLAPVLLAAIGGWFFFDPHIFVSSWNVTGGSALTVVPRATVTAFWAFLGLESAIVLSARVRHPARDIPIGTLGGIGFAALIYMAACAALMGMMPAAALAKSSAPFADAFAPVLGASVAGAVALCTMIKASGTLGSSLLLTVETAECDCVLGQMRRVPRAEPAHRASSSNLIFTGVLASLVAVATASPTLARQFTFVTNVAVVLSLLVYSTASIALLRLSARLPTTQRLLARGNAMAAAAFGAALIASSQRAVLAWSAGAVVLALVVYASTRLYRAQRAAATAASG
jgi:arginine:agmatine antiporter